MTLNEKKAEWLVNGRRVAPQRFKELLEKEGIPPERINETGERCQFMDFKVGETPIEVKAFCGGKKLKIVTKNHRKLGKQGVYVFRLDKGCWQWLTQPEVEELFYPTCETAYQKWSRVSEKSKDKDIKSLIERLKRELNIRS